MIKYLHEPLYKNSIFLALSNIFNAGCGLIFWIIAAKLYSVENVGLATVLISSLGLIILFSRLGFDLVVVRFLPTNDNKLVFSTSLITTTISSLFVGLIFIFLAGILTPSINFILNPVNSLVFFLFVVAQSSSMMIGNTLIALRKGKQFFYQNLLLGLRILLLFPLKLMGCFGIFSSWGLAYLVASIFAFSIVIKLFSLSKLRMIGGFLRESLRFSAWNYVSNLLSASPNLILPLMILNLLGKTEVAMFYIAFSIGNIYLSFSEALSLSLLVEGSHGKGLRKNAIKAIIANYLVLAPITFILFFFGDHILGLFGETYVGAFEFLRIMSISSFLVVVQSLFNPIQNVRMEVESIAKLNFFRFVLILGLSYVFILRFGIVGIGYAWMIAYGVIDLCILVLARREGWI